MPAGEAAGERGAGAPARSSRLELPQPDERHPRRSSTGTPILPTIIGLIAALAGPFLVQFVLAPLILDSPVRSSSAVLLSQG